MNKNCDDFYNLAERIADSFAEIDSDIVMELSENNDEYAAMKEESEKLKLDYPAMENVLGGNGAIEMTANEHEIFTRYVSLMRQMEDIERQRIYFRGHTDCFAYLKKIDAI